MSEKTVTMTPKIQQTGSYGIAAAHVPVKVPASQVKALLKTGNWDEGVSDRAKKRAAALKKAGSAEKAA